MISVNTLNFLIQSVYKVRKMERKKEREQSKKVGTVKKKTNGE
jgi:hypothetical protein